MGMGQLNFWQTPGHLSRQQAKILGGLAVFILFLAVGSFMSYEGPERWLHGGALALVSLTNLVLVAGDLLPDERGGRLLRVAVAPLSILMMASLFASVAAMRDEIEPSVLLIGALPVLAVALVARLLKRA